jgi:acyl-CoA synthetase (NDP forming)
MLPEPEAMALLDAYGIPYPEHGFAQSVEEAVEIAGRLEYPVVLKVVSPQAMHKSDVGGVATEIQDAPGMVRAYTGILKSVREHLPGAQVQGMLVCRQAPAGLEVIVGALRDLMFGPSLMFGLGGIFAEVLKDVTFRVIPVQRIDAKEMISEIRGYPLLAGARGQSGYDVKALIEMLLAVSRLISERPEIEELDLNPVRLHEQGLEALDVRMMLAEPGERRELKR